MSNMRELYQEVILDHNKRPRNFRRLEEANRTANGFNPLCGDKIALYLNVEDGIIKDISFEGLGCAISTASASMMTQTLKGKSIEEARRLFHSFHDMVTCGGGRPECPPDCPALGKLEAFSGVCEFPVRVKCATLAWHTLNAALEGKDDPVTTE